MLKWNNIGSNRWPNTYVLYITYAYNYIVHTCLKQDKLSIQFIRRYIVWFYGYNSKLFRFREYKLIYYPNYSGSFRLQWVNGSCLIWNLLSHAVKPKLKQCKKKIKIKISYECSISYFKIIFEIIIALVFRLLLLKCFFIFIFIQNWTRKMLPPKNVEQ